MAFWSKKKDTTPAQRSGLCILYLNCTGVGDTDIDKHVAEYKKNVFEDQNLNHFLNDNAHHFIIVPVMEQTRMEFIWF